MDRTMEYCLKSPEQGATEGVPFVRRHVIEATDKAFIAFASGDIKTGQLRKLLGVSA